MPGHLGRMRPIKRRNSNDPEGLDAPVVTHGRPGAGFDFNFSPEMQTSTERPSTGNGKGVEAGYHQAQHAKSMDEIFPHDGHSSSEGSTSRDYASRGVYSREGLLGPTAVKPSDAEILAAKQENLRWELAHIDEDPVDHSKMDYRGWADKGKELLFGLKKKK